MAEKFSCVDFIEPNIAFGVSVGLPYLLNIVTFNYSTCKCKLTLLDVLLELYLVKKLLSLSAKDAR